jgi:hypothetical protein
MKKRIFTLALFAFTFLQLWAQHDWDGTISHKEEEHRFPHYRVALLIGHTAVPADIQNDYVFISSWGLDFEYWIDNQWAIGLHNDMELQSFIIEYEEYKTLERVYPLVVSLDLIYKPVGGLVFQFGPGYEFERNESFFLFRTGVEYEIDLPHHFDLAPTLFYDNRFEANNTWTIALGVGKRF